MGSKKTGYKVEKTDAEWRAELTPAEYNVTRQAGTERAFSGALTDNKEPGTYRCVCCDKPLFASDTKFDSGSGWPSFWAPAESDAVDEHSDHKFSMVRTEVVCSDCGAHLGHVFEDGPKPTGQRYCINSVALRFDPKK